MYYMMYYVMYKIMYYKLDNHNVGLCINRMFTIKLIAMHLINPVQH